MLASSTTSSSLWLLLSVSFWTGKAPFSLSFLILLCSIILYSSSFHSLSPLLAKHFLFPIHNRFYLKLTYVVTHLFMQISKVVIMNGKIISACSMNTSIVQRQPLFPVRLYLSAYDFFILDSVWIVNDWLHRKREFDIVILGCIIPEWKLIFVWGSIPSKTLLMRWKTHVWVFIVRIRL